MAKFSKKQEIVEEPITEITENVVEEIKEEKTVAVEKPAVKENKTQKTAKEFKPESLAEFLY